MTIHHEGKNTIIITAVSLLLFNTSVFVFFCDCPLIMSLSVLISLFILFVIIFFFRKPNRKPVTDDNGVISPADGKIVVIEKVKENEYFKDERIQVSVFMSVWNVHINRFPVSGKIKYLKYHEGNYLLARNPKSSEKNERTTVVIETQNGIEIMYRQIAGIMARRIVYYAEEGKSVKQSEESGFIKFGSRVDIFLPTDSEIKVKTGDKVKGSISLIAKLSQ